MVDLIRALIRESVCELRLEDVFSDQVLDNIRPDEEVDVNVDKLQHDIPELKNYELVEYLPVSQNEEKWTFDADMAQNYLNTITVEHVRGRWRFTFAQAEKSLERMTADVGYSTPFMGSYEDMTQRANSDWQQWG